MLMRLVIGPECDKMPDSYYCTMAQPKHNVVSQIYQISALDPSHVKLIKFEYETH